MLKKIIYIILTTLALSCANISLAKESIKQEPIAIAVATTSIELSTNQQKISATGSVVANPGIIVRPEIAGRVTKIFFKPGDKVKIGDPLLEINPDIIKAELAQYEADLKLKQSSFQRAAKLYAMHVFTKAEYDTAVSGQAAAQALVEEHRAKLRQTLIVAPFAGRLGINSVNFGDYVNAGQDIVSLQALDPIYIDFSVSEINVHQISPNQELTVTSESVPNVIFKGKVLAIDPLVDAKTRSLKVRAVIPNHEEKLLPGTFAAVTLLVGSPKQIIKIPQTAVVYDNSGNYVYKDAGGRAKKTPVVLGERDKENIEIKTGLNVGDNVVTDGQLKISTDGTPITVVSKTSTSK
jgi:membrane fusion protein, multidrug efflux system